LLYREKVDHRTMVQYCCFQRLQLLNLQEEEVEVVEMPVGQRPAALSVVRLRLFQAPPLREGA
jgi:hypothetical protein